MTGEQDNDPQQTTQSQEHDEHDYVDRSKIDFDPDDGHYTGTAVEGTSDIPGPHEQGESAEEQSGSDQAEQ